MGSIVVSNLGKAYKQYPNRWARLAEWILPGSRPRHQLHWVLKDINFTINPGESVGIVGVNGAGKSTLLKMITGTTQPTTGSIQVTGRVAALLELGMGFHPEFTGRQNAMMAGQLQGRSASQMRELMPSIEDFADIGDAIDQPIRVYSSGMQVRLAFAVATASRPDILIVDEALSVGDAFFQSKCFARISSFKESGTTLMFVSHSIEEVVKHCDRALLLENGMLGVDGESRDVANRYLEGMFGPKKTSVTEPTSAKHEINERIKIGSEDFFAQRPHYRKEEHRWGHGGAAIVDYLLVTEGKHFPTAVVSNAILDVYMVARFDETRTGIVPGILIKTLEGLFLYGTNSLAASGSRQQFSVKIGDIKIFKFSLRLSLSEGSYLLSFGISHDDKGQLVPLDRRYDSVLLNVSKTNHFWGLIDLHGRFEEVSESTEPMFTVK